MSIKKERELFLYELNGHGYEFKNRAWDDHLGRFKDDQLNMVWEMWLASRNRDGFVLVPMGLSDSDADKLAADEWNKSNSLLRSEYRDLNAFEFERMRLRWCKNRAIKLQQEYKAMIGAADDH